MMRKNTIKLSLLAIVLLGTGGWFATSTLSPGSFSVDVDSDKSKDIAPTQTIKGAMAYYTSLIADAQTGKVDHNAVYEVYSQLDKFPRSKMGNWLKWDEMGPDDIGGRTRAIVIDKDNNRIIYAGGVSGGLWKSTNAGSTWTRLGDREVENINVSSLTQSADGTLYYGTGEGGFAPGGQGDGNSGFLGRGIFKSTDGGKTFEQIASTNPTGSGSVWANVHRLVADPHDKNRLYAGNDGGLYISDNAGQTWKKANAGNYTKGKYILLTPDAQTIYVAMANNNPGTSYHLFRSKDRGENFERLGTADGSKLPTSSSSFVLTMSPSNPKIIYLSSAAVNGSLDAVYRTEDGGDTWAMIGEGGPFFNPLANQGSYNHCIVVDPKNENRIVIGGLNLWEGRRINNRFQWSAMTDWSYEGGQVANPYHVHADQHILIFDKSEKPVLYVGSDGGVSKSTDFTYTEKPTFFNADFGYNTVQFYGIGVSAYDPDEVIGGTQDNGVLLVNRGGLTLLNSNKIRGGDGGFSEISRINPNAYFGEYVYGELFRSFNKGKSWSQFADANLPETGNGRWSFISIFSLWESLNDVTSIDSVSFVDEDSTYKAGTTISFKNSSGYTYTRKLTSDLPAGMAYKIQDVVQSKFFVGYIGGVSFTKEALNAGKTPEYFRILNVSGFEPHDIKATRDGNTVYVTGVRAGVGEVYRISGLSGKEFKYVNGAFNPANIGITTTRIFTKTSQIATGIAVDENDPNHVIVTLGSYGYTDHVYRSENALETGSLPTFTNISGNLPDFPVYDALINMVNRNEYLVAGEYGVWSSRNKGATWQEENEGMERVPTFMLRQMKFTSAPWEKPVIYAGTHGRGVFRTQTLTGIKEDKDNSSDNLSIDLSVYPNPTANVANVSVELAKLSDVRILLIDIQGRVVADINHGKKAAGKHNFKLETANLNKGTYFVKVITQGSEKTTKLLLMK